MAKIDEVVSPGKNSQMTNSPLHKRGGAGTGSRKCRESENDPLTSADEGQTSEPQSSPPPEGVSNRSWGSVSSGVVVLAVFVGSLVLMAAIFYQFPEMDE